MLYAEVIKTVLNKDEFNRFSKYIDRSFFGETTKGKNLWWEIYQRVASYHENHEKNLSLTTLKQSHLLAIGASSKTTVANIEQLYQSIAEVQDYEESEFLLAQVRRRGVLSEVLGSIDRELSEGKEANLGQLADSLGTITSEEDADEIRYTIDLLESEEDYEASRKWKWPWTDLDEKVQGAGPERNCLVFALTNVGKTSFVTAANVEFMRQGAKVLHFAIAEDSKISLQRRYYQAAFTVTDAELDDKKEILRDSFMEEFEGKLVLCPVDSLTIAKAEEIIKREKPDIVVFDDFKDLEIKRNKDSRDDKHYGNVAVRIKSLAIKYGFFALCCCQASNSATGKKWLERDDISDSKVDIPGKFQFCIGISRGGNDAKDLRYLSLAKNKLGPESTEGRFTLSVDEARCSWW